MKKTLYYIDGKKDVLNFNYYSEYEVGEFDVPELQLEFEFKTEKQRRKAWDLAIEDGETLEIADCDIFAWKNGYDFGNEDNNPFRGVAEKLKSLGASSEPD